MDAEIKWGLIALMAVWVVTASSCQMTNYRIAQMVEDGADPVIAACAVKTMWSSDLEKYVICEKAMRVKE